MVQEYRKIMLSEEEVSCAFDCYRRITPQFLPEGRIVSCKTSANGTVTLELETKTDNGVKIEPHTFSGINILKPLIRFCIENNIMLPRNGKKSISVIENTADLCLSLNVSIDIADPVMPILASHIAAINETHLSDMPDMIAV